MTYTALCRSFNHRVEMLPRSLPLCFLIHSFVRNKHFSSISYNVHIAMFCIHVVRLEHIFTAPQELQQTLSMSMEGAPLHLSTLNSDGRSTHSHDCSNSSLNSSGLSSGSDPMSISELVVRAPFYYNSRVVP